jgi:hypothetical protein
MDRTHTAALFKYDGIKGDTYRRLTLREAFLMMGFTTEEYVRAASLGFSYRKLNKMHIWCYKRSIFSLCVIFAQEIAAIAGGCAN